MNKTIISKAKKILCLIGVCMLLVQSICAASASPKYINCSKTTKLVLRMKAPANKKCRGQDSYTDKGIFFKFFSDDVVQMYNFKTGRLVRECAVRGKHCSVATCIPKKDGYGRMFIETNTIPSTVYVNEMKGSRPQLSRVLQFPKSKYGHHMKHVVDSSGRKLYGIAYKTGNRRSPANGNCMIISVWDIRKLKKNSNGTYTPTLIRTFNIPFIMFSQGMCFFRNKIYILSSDYVSPDTKVYAVDVYGKRITEVYQGFPSAIRNRECQGVFVDGGYLYIDAGMTVYRAAKV